MRYITICQEMLEEQYPMLCDRLKKERRFLAALKGCALDLKDSHVAWMNELRRANPQRSIDQIASEALELALETLKGDLPFESPKIEHAAEALSLDQAMESIRRPTSRA
ncbi:MAG: hypothetical protein ACLQVF_40970 [Isosphaeraceae bacterium]